MNQESLALAHVQFELLVSYLIGGSKQALRCGNLYLGNGQGLYIHIQHSSLPQWFLKPLESMISSRVGM